MNYNRKATFRVDDNNSNQHLNGEKQTTTTQKNKKNPL